MIDFVQSLVDPVLSLVSAIGAGTLGMVLFPVFLLLAALLGLRCRKSIPHSIEIAALLLVFLGLFAWQAFFLFGYPSAPGERTLVVAGWAYSPQALAYLQMNRHLLDLTWETRAIELMAAFQARPELVWEGIGLSTSRIAGGFFLCLLVFLIFATVRWPRTSSPKPTSP